VGGPASSRIARKREPASWTVILVLTGLRWTPAALGQATMKTGHSANAVITLTAEPTRSVAHPFVAERIAGGNGKQGSRIISARAGRSCPTRSAARTASSTGSPPRPRPPRLARSSGSHLTLRREWLDGRVFASLEAAQPRHRDHPRRHQGLHSHLLHPQVARERPV
jgi:hypothetical protein